MRELRAVEGNALCERWHAVDGKGRAITLLRLREEHARDQPTRDAWLALVARNRALVHPMVLSVLDFGMHAGRACASLARVDDALPLSVLLAHLRARGEQVSGALAMHVVDQLVGALAAAHRLRIDGRAAPLPHGDLCAERVLVRHDGRVQIAELGLWSALPPQRGARLRVARASASHLPPEQARGVPADARGDVYAIGVLLRRMLDAGEPNGETHRSITPMARTLAVRLGGLLAVSPAARIADLDALRAHLAGLPRHDAGRAVLAQLHADARAGVAPRLPHVPAASAATALFVRPREPLSDALTRPRAMPHGLLARGAPTFPQPPRVGEAADAVALAAPVLSPRAASCAEPDSAPTPSRTPGYREPGGTVFVERSRSRAGRGAVTVPHASTPTRIAMIISALLTVAALCLLSVLLA